MSSQTVPFALPDFDRSEFDSMRETLESGWITTGPKTHRFEEEFAKYVGARFAVAVNSCTAALHLALEAAEVQPGDLVLTTPYTFTATAEVIRYFGAIPVFVDVDRETFNMDMAALAATIEDASGHLHCGRKPRTVALARAVSGAASRKYPEPAAGAARPRLRAVIPVHIAGHACDLDTIYALGKQHNLAIVEDCAHAFPSSYKGRVLGGRPERGLPWASCFSFYATKTLSTGEGGMITTENETWANRIRSMSLHGISRNAWNRYGKGGHWYYEVTAAGYKYNMADLNAALGLVQLSKSDRMQRRREEIAARFNDAFSTVDALEIPTVMPWAQSSWHLYMLRLHEDAISIDRDTFITELQRRDIGASVHFIPLHLHPYYRDMFGYQPSDFPVALHEYQREISLPIYSRMSDADVQRVIDGVLDIVHSHPCQRERVYAVSRP